MTSIAYRDGIMAADSTVWRGQGATIKMITRPKILRLPTGLFACCGDSQEIEVWREFLGNTISKPDPFEKDTGFSCLWAKPDGTVLQCWWKLVWVKITSPFVAIGASENFMYGALHAGASAEQAVQLAIDHTDGAGGKVQVERVKPLSPVSQTEYQKQILAQKQFEILTEKQYGYGAT